MQTIGKQSPNLNIIYSLAFSEAPLCLIQNYHLMKDINITLYVVVANVVHVN